jgi:hypothetical protein
LINNKGVPSVASFVLLNSSGGGNPAPAVTSVSPNSGSAGAGTGVTIKGTNFASGATVTFGGSAATNVSVVSSTSITAKTPSHSAGAVNVAVKNSDSQSGTLSNGYTYINTAPSVASVTPASGPVAGGTGVTIKGTNFVSGATVSFGGTAATGVTVPSSTAITATTPAHAAGAVDLVVTNSNGQNGTLPKGYTYSAPADFTITASPFSPSLFAPGGSASSSIAVTGLNGFTDTVNLSCSNISPIVSPAPTCTFSPGSITGSGKSTLTFRATAGTKASLAPGSKGIFYGMWLPILGLVGLGAGLTSRQKRSCLWACLLFVCLALLTSCGGGSSSFSNSSNGVPGTPANGPMTHTASLSVTVN